MKFALYARVSSDKQEREQTIESQLAALRDHGREKGYEIEERHVYVEEFPGDRLDRPQLDALRDGARDGQFDGVLIYCPDRLARRFAYQEIVIEELERYGCRVEFIERPISDNPEDRLLLQFQGVIAEYERSKILERTRRGRLYKARQGVLVAPHAPYGYRYVPERDGVPGHLEVNPEEAEGVRQAFDWLIEEQLSSLKVAQRLRASRWKTRRGGPWRDTMVRYILGNECYTGRRHYNKTQAVEPKKRRNPRGYTKHLKSSHAMRPREEWIETPIPRLISDETFRRAQEQLKQNSRLSLRNFRQRHQYLLRCLVRCGACGRARCGRTARTGGVDYPYYVCSGLWQRPRPEPCCGSATVRVDELDRLVWDEVKRLLGNPEEILRYFREQYEGGVATTLDLSRRKLQELERQSGTLRKQERRLVDAYEAGVIELEELKERRAAVQRRRDDLQEEIKEAQKAMSTKERQRSIEEAIGAFASKFEASLEQVTFDEKQRILQLLIEKVSVDEAGHVEISYVMPVSGNLQLPLRRPGTSSHS